jgi:hypothetical protein
LNQSLCVKHSREFAVLSVFYGNRRAKFLKTCTTRKKESSEATGDTVEESEV